MADYQQSQGNGRREDVPLGTPNPAEGESITKHLIAGLLGGAQGISKLLPDVGMDKNLAKKIGYKSPIPSFEDADFKKMLGIHEPTGGAQKMAETIGEFALPLPPLAKVAGRGAKLLWHELGKGMEILAF